MISLKNMHRKPNYNELVYDLETTKLKDFSIDRRATILRRRPELTKYDEMGLFDLNNMHNIKYNMSRSANQKIYETRGVGVEVDPVTEIDDDEVGLEVGLGSLEPVGSPSTTTITNIYAPEPDDDTQDTIEAAIADQEEAESVQAAGILDLVESSLASGSAHFETTGTVGAFQTLPDLPLMEIHKKQYLELMGSFIPLKVVSLFENHATLEEIYNIYKSFKNLPTAKAGNQIAINSIIRPLMKKVQDKVQDQAVIKKYMDVLNEYDSDKADFLMNNGSKIDMYNAYIIARKPEISLSEKDEEVEKIITGIMKKMGGDDIQETIEASEAVSSSLPVVDVGVDAYITNLISKYKSSPMDAEQKEKLKNKDFSTTTAAPEILKSVIRILSLTDDILNENVRKELQNNLDVYKLGLYYNATTKKHKSNGKIKNKNT